MWPAGHMNVVDVWRSRRVKMIRHIFFHRRTTIRKHLYNTQEDSKDETQMCRTGFYLFDPSNSCRLYKEFNRAVLLISACFLSVRNEKITECSLCR